MILFKNIPIRSKLTRLIMLVSGMVSLFTCVAFFVYEFYSFRQNTIQKLSMLGEIISNNSTASLAFYNPEDATEILQALRAEPHIVAACLYDAEGKLFAWYPATLSKQVLPVKPGSKSYDFEDAHLEGFQKVMQGNRALGTLYLKSNLEEVYGRFRLYGLIVLSVVLLSFLLTYFLSRILQKSISRPILTLADTAKLIAEQQDYSVRANKSGNDELGFLTDAFNGMLAHIEEKNQELSEFNKNLEQKVTERTVELERVNKELESFSYSVSHDLRAPVRAINGYINMYIEDYGDRFDEEAERLVTTVLKNSQKMGVLIDDLLAFSKLGRKDVVKSSFSMKDLVDGIWKDLSKMEKDRNIEFVLAELPTTYAERKTIAQVWVNLISNAIKYTQNKEKAIIEISWLEKEKTVVYYIKDNGAGFDMAYYDKLFGVFQRLHSEDEFEGTGVGLAIVQRVIEKHGGKIWADSQVNEGTTFYFSLPDFHAAV